MAKNLSVIHKILWPERASLFVIVGGAIGLSGDITSFFTSFISPFALAMIFGGAALVSGLLCFQRAMLVDARDEKAVDGVVHCAVCDALRFSLFALGAFFILMMVGQGQSATQTLAEKMGLIHEDITVIGKNVDQIGEDVSKINENVDGLSDITKSQKLVENPRSAEDYFRNAWIYSNIQRDQAKAFEVLDKMYRNHAPRKMDAAELYFNTGRQIKGREELMAQTLERAHESKDATLLVIAGRNAVSEEQSKPLYAEAVDMDPDLPFSYWDTQRFVQGANAAGMGPEAQKALLLEQAEGIEKFIERIASKPANYYFFLPQYQPDYEMVARQMLANTNKILETYEQMEQQKREIRRK
ncbi:MAG: hypothetical protein IT559_07295 [Alphaproteobacteria bacterium]|nr:hypothetical protein [Alphaproteobacteria bacterium]